MLEEKNSVIFLRVTYKCLCKLIFGKRIRSNIMQRAINKGNYVLNQEKEFLVRFSKLKES